MPYDKYNIHSQLLFDLLTLFILIDYPKRIDTISMELSILYFKGGQSKFLQYNVFLSMKIIFLSKQTVQTLMKCCPMGLHCLPKNLFTGIQNKKGLTHWKK